ncbi:MAG: holo-ACP synthase [Magnetococcales bacterium]|nr:holo-ACP synthase [Magnetococcales bacterium]
MILGVGTDLVRVDRIAQARRRHGERFLRRLFTPVEQAAGRGRADLDGFLAKRFAAKEALVKALGIGMRDGVWFTDMEVVNDPLGKPVMHCSGEVARRLEHLQARAHLSLTDEGGLAMAFVVLESVAQDAP